MHLQECPERQHLARLMRKFRFSNMTAKKSDVIRWYTLPHEFNFEHNIFIFI